MKLKIFCLDENNVKLPISDECEISHDIKGNLYLKFHEKYFVLFVSSTNDIEWIELDNYDHLPLNDRKIVYSEIKNTYEKNSLKGKITKELEENNDNDEYDDYEDPEGGGYYKNKYKAYPEEKLYVKQNDNNDVNENNENIDYDTNYLDDNVDNCYQDNLYNNSYHSLSKFGQDSIICCLDRYVDVSANYDTFIMNENTSYVLATLEADEKSEYRVSLFTNGVIALNVVGSKIIFYEICYRINNLMDSQNVIIVCIKTHTKPVLY